MKLRLAGYSLGWFLLGALLGSVRFALLVGVNPIAGAAASWLGLGLACTGLMILANWPRRYR